MRVVVAALVAGCLVVACTAPGSEEARPDLDEVPESIAVTSAAFEDGAALPVRFTCDGQDLSPPLSWSDVPDDTEEIVVVVEDPDAPRGTFVHWILAGVDPTLDGLDAGEVPAGAVEGTNDFGEIGYRGPCPPEGDDPHRYEFVVQAMGEPSGLGEGVDADEFREAVAGRTIATGTLTGEYGRDG